MQATVKEVLGRISKELLQAHIDLLVEFDQTKDFRALDKATGIEQAMAILSEEIARYG